MRFPRDPYWLKKLAQEKVLKAARGRLMVFESAKHGIGDTADLARADGEIRTIVDVGANTGQSALRFRAAFPSARIISLEPIRDTFDELLGRTADLNVECHRLAVGSSAGRATMYLTPFSVTSSLVPPPAEELRGTEEVEVATLDDFLRDNGVSDVDLLKVDAEGYDLEVLKGAESTLASGRVRFVMVEIGFHRRDDRHPLFDDVRDLLTVYGYSVFGIYEQHLEWTGEPALRFANAVFCHTPEFRSAMEQA
jgi:FkbM family methyltransferase